jgi:hypothetical protein
MSFSDVLGVNNFMMKGRVYFAAYAEWAHAYRIFSFQSPHPVRAHAMHSVLCLINVFNLMQHSGVAIIRGMSRFKEFLGREGDLIHISTKIKKIRVVGISV